MAGIFLSHSHRDSALAERIEREFEKLGLPTFTARDIRAGEDWRKAIETSVRRADMLLLLIASPEAAASSWMGYEAGMAEALGKRVMVLASDRHSVSELPIDLASWPIVNFDPRSPETAARDIVERLAAA
jgi:hypothetical protein